MIALQIISFSNNPMTFITKFNHLRLYGNSGVGKTKVGQSLSFFYSKCGLLARNTFTIATSSTLISSYVSKTPQIMNSILQNTLEGVLFIDEAYSMVDNNSTLKGHGKEAIVEMVGFIDKNIGLSIIILAGYEKEMENNFMKTNEGLYRRFPNVIILKDYNSGQLTDLLRRFIALKYGPTFSKKEYNILYSYIKTISILDSSIFDKQTGDMLILAGDMLDSIYGSTKSWIPGDTKNNQKLIQNGINIFLSRKNMVWSF
jgi:hypothetical protein